MASHPHAPVDAFVALGANLGDALGTLREALFEMAHLQASQLLACSPFYGSAPIDSSGPDYVNAVAHLRTTLGAYELLQRLQAIEQAHGRKRPYVNAPRTLDLDILLYGRGCIHGPRLQIPHPRMMQRAFVLLPLADVAPDRVSADQLVAVADQRIKRLANHGLSLPIAVDCAKH